jgi:hypothetical protein
MKPKNKKYSKSNSISSNVETKNSFYNNNFKTISTFSFNIEKKEENSKDLLIQDLKQKIFELENELNEANSKLENLSKIIEELKNKNKVLYIDKIDSFNYITIQNHIIKLNNRNLSMNIKKNKKQNINNDELIIHFPKRSSLGKSPKKFVNSFTENEQFSYSSFDNYKNMNIYLRKITTFIDDKKIKKIKPNSLRKYPIKYKKILFNKKSIKKESLKNNITINKNLKINEKMIFLYIVLRMNLIFYYLTLIQKNFQSKNSKILIILKKISKKI